MRTVILKSIEIRNFRGHRDLTVNFSEKTLISGENATGKSTVFDAFVWLLFGKDQFDRRDFEIIPTFDGKRLERVDPEVTAELSVDGRIITLKRILHQKWVRRKGTAEEVFDGCDTLYYVNDVPLKMSEYKARVDMIIEETVFKLITNPATFLGLHWTKQREFLFQIAGSISDQELAGNNKGFAALLEMVDGKSLIDFKKEISTRKKKLKDDLATISPRVDQTTRLMPESRDWTALADNLKEVQKDLDAIDLQIADRSKAIRGQYDEIQAKQGQVEDLWRKQQEILFEQTSKNRKARFEQDQEREKLSFDISAARNSINLNVKKRAEFLDEIVSLKSKIESKESSLSGLRKEWSRVNEMEYNEAEGCLICPVFGTQCGDPKAIGKHQEAIEKAKSSFAKVQSTKLDEINQNGLAIRAEIKSYNDRIAELEAFEKELQEIIQGLNSNLDTLTAYKDKLPVIQEAAIVKEEIREWVDIQAEIRKIEATIQEVNPVDLSDINDKKSGLIQQRDELKRKLSDRDIIRKHQEEIQHLNELGSDLAQQIADIEQLEFTIEAFNKAKSEELDRRVNGLFSFVRFKLFDTTIDGNEFEACIPTNASGVPISVTNTAEKINSGLDIINALSEHFQVKAPIFCDGSESVNNYIPSGSQMVFLKVTKEQSLTISVN